jgi:hypothetical protein
MSDFKSILVMMGAHAFGEGAQGQAHWHICPRKMMRGPFGPESLGAPSGRKPSLVRFLQYCWSLLGDLKVIKVTQIYFKVLFLLGFNLCSSKLLRSDINC